MSRVIQNYYNRVKMISCWAPAGAERAKYSQRSYTLAQHFSVLFIERRLAGPGARTRRAARGPRGLYWSPMEPPAFPEFGLQTVRAAPGSAAALVLPLPSGTPPFTYAWYVLFPDRFYASPRVINMHASCASQNTSIPRIKSWYKEG